MSQVPAGTLSEMATRDGRTIGLCEVGDPTGPLVIHNHGGPSSRLEARLFGPVAESLGLRVVGADRPGQGVSSPQHPRTFRGWADDMLEIADSLGAERFGVLGWSEGGPWSIAAAAYIPQDRAVHVAEIAGGCYGAFGPNAAARHLDAVDAMGGRLALHFHPGFRLMYDVLGITATKMRGTYGKSLAKAACDADKAVLADEAVLDAFLESSAECFRHGAKGLTDDATVLYGAWDMDVTSIERPLHIWQGVDDTLVPEAINREVAERTPGAVYHPVADAGHFVAVSHAEEILGLAAADLRG